MEVTFTGSSTASPYLHSEAEATHVLERLETVDCPTVLSFVNAQSINVARCNPQLLSSLLASSVLLRDGVGVSILLRLFGIAPGWNTNGTDFIPKLLERFKGRRVALIGTTEPYTSRAAAHAASCGCKVSLISSGFCSPEFYVRAVRTARPELVILGMGTPKQEEVAELLAHKADCPMLVVNGGAILDRWAGRWRRAPVILRRVGAEWAFRLAQEPRRLSHRYLVGNLSFVGWALMIRFLGGCRPSVLPAGDDYGAERTASLAHSGRGGPRGPLPDFYPKGRVDYRLSPQQEEDGG